MGYVGGKSAAILCILRILEEYSDYDHPMTSNDIIKRLDTDYGIELARNAIGRNITLLMDLGYDIESTNRGYYITEHEFDDTELYALIDSVLTSKYIPKRNAKDLIDKLGRLSNSHFRSRIPQVDTLDQWHHQHNMDFFYGLEILWESIFQNKKVSFYYNKYNEKGEFVHRRETKSIVSPYQLVCTNGQYYLLASYDDYDRMSHFRVDRMTQIEKLDEKSRDIKTLEGFRNGLDIGKYVAQHNMMYGGSPEKIVLKVKKDNVSEIIDQFGADIKLSAYDDEHVKAQITTTASGMRYWAMQFGTVCEVLEPESLREKIKQDVQIIYEKYLNKE